jgi:hypothetical protein
VSEQPLCAVVYPEEQGPDAALAEAARRLQAAGLRVGGLLQEGQSGGPSCCASLRLRDIATGRRVALFQDRGAGSRGCRLDPSGLAEAAGWLREAIEARPDVLFVNRFGRQEAGGRGLLDEIGCATVSDIPVVVPVPESLWPSWLAFVEGGSSAVAPDAGAIAAWCLERIRQPAL